MKQPNPRPNLRGPRRKGKRPTKAELAELRRKREALDIPLDLVAAEAAKTSRYGTMNRATASRALYDGSSVNVLDALRRLIAAREQQPAGKVQVA